MVDDTQMMVDVTCMQCVINSRCITDEFKRFPLKCYIYKKQRRWNAVVISNGTVSTNNKKVLEIRILNINIVYFVYLVNYWYNIKLLSLMVEIHIHSIYKKAMQDE